jgi:hypothetical protein
MTVGVHSRELALASARSLPSAVLVPPLPFLPASTVCSTNRFAGLLRPASDPEVHRVAAPRGRMPATASALSLRCLPSRAFPFREAVPASPRVLAPLSLPGNAGATTRPCSARKSVATDGSWPNRIARCSPGLPHLEPHLNATPPQRPRTGIRRAPRIRASANRSGGRVRHTSATAARRHRPHRRCGEGRSGQHHCRASMPLGPDRLRRHRSGILAGLAPERRRSSSQVDPAAPREIAGRPPARLARGRACRSSIRGVQGPSRRVGAIAEAIGLVCSAAFREVGGRRR